MTHLDKLGQWIDYYARYIARLIIKIYQKILSPDTGLMRYFFVHRVCSHDPRCSNYGLLCFKDFNFFRASMMTLERISRCGPSSTISYDPHRFRIAFASSAPIGISFLDAIAKHNRCDLVCVITMPDAPQGRGMMIQENSIARHAQHYCKPDDILKPSKINPLKSDEGAKFSQKLRDYDIDYLVVIAYGKIIPQSILDIPKILPINVHGSLLPAYRGASPIQQTLLDGCIQTGITIIKMEAGLDTGPMMSTHTIALTPETNASQLIDAMKNHGPSLLIDTMINYPRGYCPLISQDDTHASHTKKITKDDGTINPLADTIQTIMRKYNAYYLWPKIRFEYQGCMHTIESLTIDTELLQDTCHSGRRDTLRTQNTTLSIWIKDICIKPENKKSMTRDQWTQRIDNRKK